VEIAIIEARYPYKMSYLDEWLNAWKLSAEGSQEFNVLKDSEIKALEKSISRFDLIVILHSVTADSNKWLNDLSGALSKRSCPIILFVGNEYSNPWLSMEVRLQNIAKIAPDIIATQLTQESGDFLYQGLCTMVVETPHALPFKENSNEKETKRNLDLGFRGFDYPWFLLDTDRNRIVEEVENFYLSSNLSVDISKSERLDKRSWYDFLSRCKTTVASEGGSNYVFRSDDVWVQALRYLDSVSAKKYLANDFRGAKLLRSLPSSVKTNLRSIGKIVGKEQGAMSLLQQDVLEEVLSRINVDDYQFVSGKALTSRHLDAVYCGTWQILTPGSYNGILKAGSHFSAWDAKNPTSVLQEVEEAINSGKSLSIYKELIQDNSYVSRISKLMDRLYS
jgi:hypothetical protein